MTIRSKTGWVALAILTLTSVDLPAQAPAQRLFSCRKPNGVWQDGLSKVKCLSIKGQWLPKDEDSICTLKPYHGIPENYVLGGTEQNCALLNGRWLSKGDNI